MYNPETDIVTDGITAGADLRQQRGLEIAAIARIEKRDGLYIVPSQTSPRPTRYKVDMSGENPACDCPDHVLRACKCKHIYAVEYTIRREQSVTVDPDGTVTETESVTVTKTRKTYPQDWPAYNAAQTNEKREFQRLLHDLCATIPQPPPEPGRKGRPPIPLSDAIFSAAFKVYSTVSARRFTCDLADAHGKGLIDKVPHFNSVLNCFEDPDTFPVLVDLIQRSALPLQSIESDFAVDSTGFAFCRFVRWYDIKYNRFTAEQQWVKAHICTGVKTNVVTAVEIHGRDAKDAPILPALVDTTAKGFTIAEVSADKGYSSRGVHDAIAKVGAVPYVAFKGNTTGGVGGLFAKMYHYFQFNRDDFLAHYHKRSNVESTVMMIKSKFGDAVRSKSDVAARNEVLCHNVCCLISAIYELGIQPVFGLPAAT